jgi:pilus assembly protein Flp/PilA
MQFLLSRFIAAQTAMAERAENGASAVEYALIVAAIAGIIVAVVFGVGTLIHDKFASTSDCISQGAAATC